MAERSQCFAARSGNENGRSALPLRDGGGSSTSAPGLVVLGGVEVSGRNGDLLCYGVTDLSDLRRGMGWGDLCREVRRQGGAAVAAHPFRWGQDFEGLIAEEQPDLAGLEMMSNNMDPDIRRRTADYLGRNPRFTTLGNSDAHELEVLGICYTEFDAEIRSSADLVEAIRGRIGRPRDRYG